MNEPGGKNNWFSRIEDINSFVQNGMGKEPLE